MTCLNRALDVPATSAAPHLGVSVRGILLTRTLAALFPLAAGLMLYGWRAAGVVTGVVLCALGSAAVWRRIGRRGDSIDLPTVFYASILLALLLPAHLFSLRQIESGIVVWPIIPAASATMVMLMWLLGGSARVHTILLTLLTMVVLFQGALPAQSVLGLNRVLVGDVLDAAPIEPAAAREPWIHASPLESHDAMFLQSAGEQLTLFTAGYETPDRSWLSMETLIRDRLPPLEDLIVAGQPGPIGCSSAVAVIVGGLFLLYRGLIDWRIPLLIVLSAWVSLLVLPVPTVVTEQGPQWQWLAWRESAATWAVAVTFANYEVLASPLLFAAFFLAPAPSIRPMARWGRAVFAVIVGVTTAAWQLYFGTSTGPLVGVLIGGMLSPALDRMWRGRSPVTGGLIARGI